ncbi:MAG: TonB-dependent receptor [Bacteroidota bacterium]
MLRLILIFSFLFLLYYQSSGQTVFNGQIKDAVGNPIIGANVYLSGTYDGSTSDMEGHYHFSSSAFMDSAVLVISYVGFETQEIAIIIDTDTITNEVRLKELVNELNELVITAGSFEASDEKKAVLLKSLDIALTAGATADIAGALNTLPGTQRVGEEGQLFVRGGAAYETKTFIDGLLVLKPFNSTLPDLPTRNRFSPFLFKGTMFSTGGYSAEYGQALSSALVLNTQDLAPQNLTSISLMSIGLGAGHTEVWDKSSLSVTADYTNLTPYVGLIPQNINWHKAPQGMNGQLIYRKLSGKNGIFKFQVQTSNSAFGLDYPKAENVLENARVDLSNNNTYVNSTYKNIFSEKWSIWIGTAFSHDVDQINERIGIRINDNALQSKVKLSFFANDDMTLRTGLTYWYDSYEQSMDFSPENKQSYFLADNYWANFYELDWKFSDKLMFRMGARAEYSSLVDEVNVAPRLSLAYKTAKHSQLSFAYGVFVQNPEKEFWIQNRNLNYERATHWIANYQWRKDKRTFRFELYQKDYLDLVVFTPNQVWNSSNNGDGYARGIDVFYRDQETFKNVDFWLSYSYLDTKRLQLDAPELAIPGFASRHNISVVYKQQLPAINTIMGMTYAYSSPRVYDDPNGLAFNENRTKAFQDLSFNFSFLTRVFDNFSVLYVSVNNLLGFEQTFGRRYSDTPDQNGQFSSVAIQTPANQFVFTGLFISIGQ